MQDEMLDAGRRASTSLEKHAERIDDVLDSLYQSINQTLMKELTELREIIDVFSGIIIRIHANC